MASTTFVLENARKSILEDGFFLINDSVVGEHVLEMQQKEFPFSLEYGLDFCKLNVLDNTVGNRTKISLIAANSCSVFNAYLSLYLNGPVLDFV